MIIGIGTDLIEMDRIRKALSSSFLKRYYSEAEQQMFLSFEKAGETEDMLLVKPRVQEMAAGNFAAKEAVVKAFGTGFSKGICPNEISILRQPDGKPYVVLEGVSASLAKQLGVCQIHVSITNIREFAQAFAVCEGSIRERGE